MLAEVTPNFSNVAHVPTLMQCEVRGVSHSGNRMGNNLVCTNFNAAAKPVPEVKQPHNAESALSYKNACKNKDNPGNATCCKSKILKHRSLEKEPLQKASEKRKTSASGKKVQSATRKAAAVDALHPKT